MKIGIFSLLISGCSCFYISGWSPNILADGDKVQLNFNKIYSEKSQLAFAFYDLPFLCAPSEGGSQALNFGEIFQGDRITPSDTFFPAKKDLENQKLCAPISLTAHQVADLQQYVGDMYRVEWILDGLPAGSLQKDSEGKDEYDTGFELGQVDDDDEKSMYLNNFFQITIPYEVVANGVLIVGFEVVPSSRKVDKNCVPVGEEKLKIDKESLKLLQYCYSVKWEKSETVDWNHRWDRYIDNSNPKIHWYSLINSIMLLSVLTMIFAFILLAALRKDIAMYNDEETATESQDDAIGWKLVHGDVFRAPKRLWLLCPIIGAGIQLLAASGFTLAFALFGVLNPSYRGGLLQYGLFFYAFSGLFAGYHSSRIFKSFKGSAKIWLNNAFYTAMFFPVIVFVLVCVLNTFYWAWHSSLALPAGTFFALLFIWLGISLPLTIIGAYFGNKKQAIEHPVRTNQIPRQIPQQSVYLKFFPSIMLGGIVPFTVIFMELFFIFKSMWNDQYYYMFGFLAVVFVLLIITCIEVTIAMIYFQLCSEDYRWQWKSIWIASSSTWYIFGLGLYWLGSNVQEVSSAVNFLINLIIGMCMYFATTGVVGFLSSYWFLRKIYSALKVD